jgi:hypothetical protein
MSRPPKPPTPGARPRTFEEAGARPLPCRSYSSCRDGESFDGVSVHPDCEGGSHWFVEWFDSGGLLRRLLLPQQL